MSGEGGAVDIQHEYTSETLGVTVRFHRPLRGRHYDEYQKVIRSAEDASDAALLFAAALTIIDEWESDDEHYAHPAKMDYEEADFSLVWWLGQVGAQYVREVRGVPFRSLGKPHDTPEVKTAPPTN